MRKADNPPPSYTVVTKSGNLNFLESSGPVQACNGIALPFTVTNIPTNKGTWRQEASIENKPERKRNYST